MNAYSYVDANPVSWLDPLGLAKLQYVLIDSFGGDPTNTSKSTLKAGTDPRMVHFALMLSWDKTPAWSNAPAYGDSVIYDPNGIETQTRDKGWYGFNHVGVGDGPWQQFLNFYKTGYGGSNAVNTGDWAITDIDDTAAAGLYKQITGNYPEGYSAPTEGCSKPIHDLLPGLPQGFYAMEHFNFPTIIHKFTKPIFDVAQLPAANDAAFHTFPWHNELTKPAEAKDSEAIVPHWPTYGSGITLGRGFDLSKFSSNSDLIKTVLKRVGIDNKLITDAVGLSTKNQNDAKGNPIPKSDAASQYWKAHKTELQKITLTAEQQYLLSLYAFEAKETNIHNVPGASSGVIKLYNEYIKGSTGLDWDKLDSKIQDVLFDLNYRGDFHDLSGNTTQKSRTSFDDVDFAKSFRDAVQANNLGDLCQVMSKVEWKDKNSWNVPPNRFDERLNFITGGAEECPN